MPKASRFGSQRGGTSGKAAISVVYAERSKLGAGAFRSRRPPVGVFARRFASGPAARPGHDPGRGQRGEANVDLWPAGAPVKGNKLGTAAGRDPGGNPGSIKGPVPQGSSTRTSLRWSGRSLRPSPRSDNQATTVVTPSRSAPRSSRQGGATGGAWSFPAARFRRIEST